MNCYEIITHYLSKPMTYNHISQILSLIINHNYLTMTNARAPTTTTTNSVPAVADTITTIGSAV